MPILSNIEVRTGNPTESYASHGIDTGQGYLRARQFNTTGHYEIQDYLIYLHYRGKGYGKEMLKIADYHARLLGASAITAPHITTRESLDALKSVFGVDSVSIKSLGGYAREDSGQRLLNHTKASMISPPGGQGSIDKEYATAVEESLAGVAPLIWTYNK